MKNAPARRMRTPAGRWPSAGLLILLALTLAACNLGQQGGQTSDILSTYLPTDWKPVTSGTNVQGFQQVNIDGDEDPEWLYFYHYDNQSNGTILGPIGGIIYDAQYSTRPEGDSRQPTAFFVPYRLLPDWREGKATGYLGEASLAWAQAYADANTNIELTVLGYSAGNLLTRLSLFRWQSLELGYGATNFVGNGGLLLTPAPASGATQIPLITQVVAFNRINDRSRLCEQVAYQRVETENRFVASPPSIVFCPLTAGTPGVPDQPTYPEAVVMTWLLGDKNAALALNNDALIAVVPGAVQRVVHLQYPGAATRISRGEFVAEMTVQTEIVTSDGPQVVAWTLLEQGANEQQRTNRWRIAAAQRIE